MVLPRMILKGGGTPARTMIAKLQALVLPAASVAVTVTAFVPTGNAAPEGGFAARLESEQSSAPRTGKLTTAGQLPVAMTVMLAGQVTIGGKVSTRIGTLTELAAVQLGAMLVRRVNPTFPDAPAV